MGAAEKKIIKFKTSEELKAWRSSCTCEKCIACCKRSPGWFLPEEITPLADFLKLSVEETYKQYLIMDYWMTEENEIDILTPIKILPGIDDLLNPLKVLPGIEGIPNPMEAYTALKFGLDKTGGRASIEYGFIQAPCIFLENDRCKIYSVRPFECAITGHIGGSYEEIRDIIAGEWEKVWDGKGKLKNILGRRKTNRKNKKGDKKCLAD